MGGGVAETPFPSASLRGGLHCSFRLRSTNVGFLAVQTLHCNVSAIVVENVMVETLRCNVCTNIEKSFAAWSIHCNCK